MPEVPQGNAMGWPFSGSNHARQFSDVSPHLKEYHPMNTSPIAQVSHATDMAVTNVAQTANELAATVRTATHDALDGLRNATQALRGQVSLAGERSTRYVRDEPVKSVLIAAAVGATVVALLGWLALTSRSSSR